MLDRRGFLRATIAVAGAVACGGGAMRGASASGVERLHYGDDPSQFGELRVPDRAAPVPVVVVLHGGYWQERYGLDLMTPLAEAFGRESIATWNVEYRRLGQPGGGYPGTFDDVASAAAFLRRVKASRALDLDHVTALGHSAGGELALWLARFGPRDPTIARVVALGPVTDLRHLGENGSEPVRRLLGADADRAALYPKVSPVEFVPLGVPTTIIHGAADAIVPIADSERYVAAARARGDDATLVRLDGIGHVEPIDPASPAWPAVLRAVRGA